MTWMNFKGIKLSTKKANHKVVYHMIPRIQLSKKDKIIEMENRLMVVMVQWWWEEEWAARERSLQRWNSFVSDRRGGYASLHV